MPNFNLIRAIMLLSGRACINDIRWLW